jgi:hypothetical protein
MPPTRRTPAEYIEVTDQVGKRHVVVKYSKPGDASSNTDRALDGAEATHEYRLATGRIVDRIGEGTFQTADGRLRLKVL